MKSNVFQTISSNRPESSKFDLTHNRKFSLEPGKLYPVLCHQALPSGVYSYDCNAVMRMAPMLSPIMHMVDVCVHSFFYPERLTQTRGNFEIFITGGKNGDGKNALGVTIEAPYFVVKGTGSTDVNAISLSDDMGEGTLADFLGIQFPDDVATGFTQRINARPFIAFWRIHNEYFRDQNVDKDYVGLYPGIFDHPGGNMTSIIFAAMTADPEFLFPFFQIPKVCWEKDYFTSALPFAQRGEPVDVPLTGQATITYKENSDVFQGDGSPAFASGNLTAEVGPSVLGVPGAIGQVFGRIENIDELNLNAGGFSITALRTAARLQEWLEKMATGGSRYIEQIKAQFGVTSSDARLQRAEYLGGGKIPMHISEVVQTAPDGATPLAEMAGHGVTAGQITTYKKFVEEHGFFMSFIFLRPKTAYQQGLSRMWWDRFDKLDYPWPSFARIGEQEVLSKEIYFQCDGGTNDDDVFGYQQRYADWKYIPSTVHGEFRSTLDFWHWGRIFGSRPTLSPEFIQCDPDPRIFNVLSDANDTLYCIVNNRMTAKLPLPYYGEPRL